MQTSDVGVCLCGHNGLAQIDQHCSVFRDRLHFPVGEIRVEVRVERCLSFILDYISIPEPWVI